MPFISLFLSSTGFNTDNEWTQPWPRRELLQSGGGLHCCLHRARSHSISHPSLTCSLFWATIFFFSFFHPSSSLFFLSDPNIFFPFSLFISVFIFPFFLCLFLSCAHTLSQFYPVSSSLFSFYLSDFQNGSWPLTKQNDRPINQPLILRLLYSREHKHTSVYTHLHTGTMQATSLSHSGLLKQITLVSW